jgi:hypothetical protein
MLARTNFEALSRGWLDRRQAVQEFITRPQGYGSQSRTYCCN